MNMCKWKCGSENEIIGQRMLPVRGSKEMEWEYDDDHCVWGTKETEIHVLFECKCYDLVRRRWMRTCDELEEKKKQWT